MGMPTKLAVMAAGVVSMAAAFDELSSTDYCDSSLYRGKMPVEGGQEVWLGGEGGDVLDGALHIRHDSGLTAFSQCKRATWEPENFHMFELLGKRMSFDVDLSRVGCACNLAFYLIVAPARDKDGEFSPGTDRGGQPPYYCDANMVGGQWCPEVDIMEANNHVLQATVHSCGSPMKGHYDYCDRSGCDGSTKDLLNAYGPGSAYTIDTTKAFTVTTDFLEAHGNLTGMITTLVQGRHSVVLDHISCKLEYLVKLSDVLRKGMSLRITYWGGDAQTMAWLDQARCNMTAQCEGDHAGDALISEIKLQIVPHKVYKEQAARLAATTLAPNTWWSPAEATAAPPADPKAWTEQWVSDIYQSWQCHVYSNPEQEMAKWCVTAGFQNDGFEYQYNGGMRGPCGDCVCCMRKAKKSWAPQTTTPGMSDGFVWIVVDPKDDHFGQVVPEKIMEDRSHFVRLGTQGVAHWEEQFRFVKLVSRAEQVRFITNGGSSDLDRIIMQKFSSESGSLLPASLSVAWDRWLTAAGIPACLLVVFVAGFAVAGCRRLKKSSPRTAQTPPGTPRTGRVLRLPDTLSVAEESPSSYATSPTAGFGATPIRRTRSSSQVMLMPRQLGSVGPTASSQNLLWNWSGGGTRSESESNLAGLWAADHDAVA